MRNPFRRRRTGGQDESRVIEPPSAIPPPGSVFSGGSFNFPVDYAARLAPVFGAGRIIASSVSSLPLQVYRKSSDGTRTELQLPALFASPSTTGTLRDWLFRAVTSMVYRGNAVGLVTDRDNYEYPTRIEWLDADDVTVEDSLPTSGRGSYLDPIWYWRGIELPSTDIVHIPWFSLAWRTWGLSPMGAFAQSVGTALDAQRFSSDWFKSGGTPPGEYGNEDKEINQQEAQIIKARLVHAIRSREPIVHGKGWKYTPITVNLAEAQFVETMRLTATDIATVYGIPPEMLGGESGNSMTYANEEQHDLRFMRYTLLPWLTTLESHLSQLLPRGQYVKFNVDAMTRPDTQTRYASHQIARNIGLMNVDEIRALEDLPPIPGPRGNDYTPIPVQVKAAAPPVMPPEPAAEVPADGQRALTPADFGVTGFDLRLANELEHYWKHGEGAAIVAWGTPGDWTRCHAELTKHVGDARARRICAQWHHDMTGLWPGDAKNK